MRRDLVEEIARAALSAAGYDAPRHETARWLAARGAPAGDLREDFLARLVPALEGILGGAPAGGPVEHSDLEACPTWYDGCRCGSLVVALVGCSARKADAEGELPARDLYVGDLFRASVALCEALGLEWAIASAGRGLVMPDELVRAYDSALSDLGRQERALWASGVADAAVARWPGRPFEVHAGATYADPLVAALRARGAEARSAYEDARARWSARSPRVGSERWGIGALRRELARALAEVRP